MDGLIQERAQQVRYHTNQLGGMELYRIYTDSSEKDRKRENLNGSNGKEHIECSLRTIGIAKSRNTVVSSVEHQVFELMTSIYKEVVNTHHLEVHRIILAFGDTVLYLVQFYFECLFAFLQAFEHGFGNVLAF